MSSPNLNNIILLGALLAFMAIIFSGADSIHIPPNLHLMACKVSCFIYHSDLKLRPSHFVMSKLPFNHFKLVTEILLGPHFLRDLDDIKDPCYTQKQRAC